MDRHHYRVHFSVLFACCAAVVLIGVVAIVHAAQPPVSCVWRVLAAWCLTGLSLSSARPALKPLAVG
jgi:hypothetical protein